MLLGDCPAFLTAAEALHSLVVSEHVRISQLTSDLPGMARPAAEMIQARRRAAGGDVRLPLGEGF